MCEPFSPAECMASPRPSLDPCNKVYAGGCTTVKEALRDIRPIMPAGFEVRFETPPGRQAHVDFAHFLTVFTDKPSVEPSDDAIGTVLAVIDDLQQIPMPHVHVISHYSKGLITIPKVRH